MEKKEKRKEKRQNKVECRVRTEPGESKSRKKAERPTDTQAYNILQ